MSEIKIGRMRLARLAEIPTHYAIEDIKEGQAVIDMQMNMIEDNARLTAPVNVFKNHYRHIMVDIKPRVIAPSILIHVEPRMKEEETDMGEFWWVMCLILLVVGVIVVFLFPFIQHLTNTLL